MNRLASVEQATPRRMSAGQLQRPTRRRITNVGKSKSTLLSIPRRLPSSVDTHAQVTMDIFVRDFRLTGKVRNRDSTGVGRGSSAAACASAAKDRCESQSSLENCVTTATERRAQGE